MYSSSAGGKHLSNDTQARVITSIEPEICMKMLKNYTLKNWEKHFSVVWISHFDGAFSGILELEARSVEGEQL